MTKYITKEHIRAEFCCYYVFQNKSERSHKLSDIASMVPQETFF